MKCPKCGATLIPRGPDGICPAGHLAKLSDQQAFLERLGKLVDEAPLSAEEAREILDEAGIDSEAAYARLKEMIAKMSGDGDAT